LARQRKTAGKGEIYTALRVGFVTLGQEASMTDITLASLSLLIALFTMMVAAEIGQRRRSRH
jgi:hypothetical protein